MWDPKEQQNHDEHMARVSELRSQVASGILDPAKPTSYGQGSHYKMALMTVRSEMEIPLFIEGDSQACHTESVIRNPVSPSAPRIHRLRMGRAA